MGCGRDDCPVKYPVFNILGQSKGRFCKEHAEPGMVDVKNTRCHSAGCSIRPTFDVVGGKGRFCKEHAEPGMVDVKNRRCEQCPTHARYGIPAKEASACARHVKAGMIVDPRRTCSHAKCTQTGTHELDKKRLCEAHAPPEATNLALEPCTSCTLLYVLTNGLCENCNPEAVKRARHEKELHVKGLLDFAGLKYETHDRVLEGGACGLERPDFVFDAGGHMVVLEVDENQHRGYACLCEQQRMVNVSQALGMPTRFVRYNPDAFKGARVSKAAREATLVQNVKWALEHGPRDAFCDAIYLFYDGYSAAGEPECHKLL